MQPLLFKPIVTLICFGLFACKSKNDVVSYSKSNQQVSFSVFIQPLGHFSSELAKMLQVEIEKKLPVNVSLMPMLDLPTNAWYAPRHRYWADSILVLLHPLHTQKNSFTLGITEEDISTTKGVQHNWGVMGLGFEPGNCCVVSTYRLYKYPQTEKQLLEKLVKVCLHELGHNVGLGHCTNTLCIMTDAKGKDNLSSEIDFCPLCVKMLTAKGLQPKINKSF